MALRTISCLALGLLACATSPAAPASESTLDRVENLLFESADYWRKTPAGSERKSTERRTAAELLLSTREMDSLPEETVQALLSMPCELFVLLGVGKVLILRGIDVSLDRWDCAYPPKAIEVGVFRCRVGSPASWSELQSRIERHPQPYWDVIEEFEYLTAYPVIAECYGDEGSATFVQMAFSHFLRWGAPREAESKAPEMLPHFVIYDDWISMEGMYADLSGRDPARATDVLAAVFDRLPESILHRDPRAPQPLRNGHLARVEDTMDFLPVFLDWYVASLPPGTDAAALLRTKAGEVEEQRRLVEQELRRTRVEPSKKEIISGLNWNIQKCEAVKAVLLEYAGRLSVSSATTGE
jgi:hypothetical protein